MLPPMAERSSTPQVAVFDAVEDQQRLITATLRVLGCRVHVLIPGPTGMADIIEQLERHGPFDAILWDLSPVLRASCDDLTSLWDRGAFARSGLVITTTEEPLVAPMLGPLSAQAQVLAQPYTFTRLMQAVDAAGADGARRALAGSHAGALAGPLAGAAAEATPALCRLRPRPVL